MTTQRRYPVRTFLAAPVLFCVAAILLAGTGRQQVVGPPQGAKRIFACSARPFRALSMSLEAQRSPVVDETAFVVTRATFSNSGEITVVDAGAGEVMKVGRNLQVLGRFGRRGEGPGEFGRPVDAGADAQGRVWVLDTEPSSLLLYDAEGRFQKEVKLPGLGSRLAVGDDAVYVSAPVLNLGGGGPELPILWRYDAVLDQVEALVVFNPSWIGRPPIYANTITNTIPKVGRDGKVYLGFEETNEVWRVHADGSHEVVVRGCVPRDLLEVYRGRTRQERRSGVLVADFAVMADGAIHVRGGLTAEGGGRPWETYAPSGDLVGAWSLEPSGMLNLYVSIDPLDPGTHLTWDRQTGSATLVRVAR